MQLSIQMPTKTKIINFNFFVNPFKQKQNTILTEQTSKQKFTLYYILEGIIIKVVVALTKLCTFLLKVLSYCKK